MKTLAIAGTFDSKGLEFEYIKLVAEKLGVKTLMIHTGVFESLFKPDIDNSEIAEIVNKNIEELISKKDRGYAMDVLSSGLEILIPKLYSEGKFDGIISFGGSGGTSLIAKAMQKLPVGVPKMLVSTMASGDISEYVGESDIIMLPSIVDISGLNQISRTIFKNAIMSMCGMLNYKNELNITLNEEETIHKPLIAATMFGVTTPCINHAKSILEEEGYEVLVFHATGSGGKSMESLINSDFFTAVLDITTTEWCDEVVGGVLAAGINRCEAAINKGLPQVVSVGALDMVNFGSIKSVPEKFKDRNLYKHNSTVTLMRTTAEESKLIGYELAKRWNQTKVPIILLLPELGVSMLDSENQPFDDPEIREVLFNTIENNISNPLVTIKRLNNNINDEEFSKEAAYKLLELIKEGEK